MTTVPTSDWLISVDDHVIEPPNVWIDRLPAKYQDVGPRMKDSVWLYEDKEIVTAGLSVCAGKDKEDFSLDPVTYDDMRPGCYDPIARVADMDEAGILASLNFPSFPRFCGQIFWEAKDKELALLCVTAYNDWMIDEWCATDPGRFIPLDHHPAVGSRQLAVEEIERMRTPRAPTSILLLRELPSRSACRRSTTRPLLGSGAWRPRNDTEIVLSIHIGSSSTMPTISDDSPVHGQLSLGCIRPAGAMLDWIFSGIVPAVPRTSRSPCPRASIGWIPCFLERAEQVSTTQRHWVEQKDIRMYAGRRRLDRSRRRPHGRPRSARYPQGLPRALLRLLHRRRHRPAAARRDR